MSQMLQIQVALMSGNPELLTLAPSSTVQDVMTKNETNIFAPKNGGFQQESPFSGVYVSFREGRAWISQKGDALEKEIADQQMASVDIFGSKSMTVCT